MTELEQNEIGGVEAVDLQWVFDKQRELFIFGQTSFKVKVDRELGSIGFKAVVEKDNEITIISPDCKI